MDIKTISFLFSGIALLATTPHTSFAANQICKENFGELYCSAGDIDTINHLGDTVIAGTHVLKQLTVLGDLRATDAQIRAGNITGKVTASSLVTLGNLYSIGIFQTEHSKFSAATKIIGNYNGNNDLFNGQTEIIGDATFNSDTFSVPATFTGNMSAKTSQFNAPIYINSCRAEFNQSSTNMIQMNVQQNCPNKVQEIFLHNKTRVNGNIQFLGSNGLVHVSQNSAISGQVIGGTVIRE